jgi:hypothetical protein
MTSEPSLDDLAIRHGVDKSSKVHGYTRAYERHFAIFRDRPIRLLGIGVGGGGSLRMWRDYFPHAAVYGLDVKDCRPPEGERIRIFQGSQDDEQVLERLAAQAGPLDVVIDDGSHRWSDQITAFKALYPHLAPGGCYVIEDLHTSYWDQYKRGAERTLSFLRELVHEINLNGKSGYGRIENDPEYQTLASRLNLYERTLESLTFYKSIVFIQKKADAGA